MKNTVILTIAFLILLPLLMGCEKSAFDKALETNTLQSYTEFIEKYPNGKYSGIVESLIEEEKFRNAKKLNTVSAYSEFLKQYPSGTYTDKAKELIQVIHFKETHANSSEYEKYGVLLKPFNSHPINLFADKMNKKIAREDLPPFKQLLENQKIDPSFLNQNNITKIVIIPLIGNNFRDAKFAFVTHNVKNLIPVLITSNPKLSFTIEPVPSKFDFEFPYGYVHRYIPNQNIEASLILKGNSPKPVLISSFIHHDGVCDFTKHYVVFKNELNHVDKDEPALLIFGQNIDLKMNIKKIENNIVESSEFWSADIDGDNINDFIWGYNLKYRGKAHYNIFYSAYNLDGKWIPWILKNSKYWDTGC